MRAYSQDLRDRVISHYNTGKYQIKDLAKMFDMTRQTIASWVKRYKETGDYSSRQHLSKGREIRFNDSAKVLEYLETNPNADGITIRDNVASDLPMSTFYDALARMGITYKKKSQSIRDETKAREKLLWKKSIS